MISVIGMVVEDGTSRPVPGLIASVILKRGVDGRSDELLLGTDVTGRDGTFAVAAEPGDTTSKSEINLLLSPPDSGGREAPEPIYTSSPFLLAADGILRKTIRLTPDEIAAAGLVAAGGEDDGLAARVADAARRAEASESAVGAALSGRLKTDAESAEHFRSAFLPRFLNESIAGDGLSLGAYDYVVGDDDKADPGNLARLSIETGIAAMRAARGQGGGGRRRTRFFFTDDQLEELDALTGPGGADGPVSETDLFAILDLAQPGEAGGVLPTEISREDELFAEFLTETHAERCAADFLRADGGGTVAPGTDDGNGDGGPDPATTDDIKRKITETIADIRSPRATLTGGDGAEAPLAQAIQDFAIPVGPADEPRVFDFSSLEVAFDDVWQTVVDQRLEPLAEALFVKTERVLGGNMPSEAALQSFASLRTALAAGRRAVTSSAPTVLALRKDDLGRPIGGINLDDGLDFVIPDPIQPPPPNPDPPDDPDGPFFPGQFEFDDTGLEFIDDSNTPKPNPDATPEDLADQIDAILREPHSFTAFGADGRSKAINFGLAIGYRHIMTPVTYQVGDLVKSVTLAPNESREYSTTMSTVRKRAEKELIKNSSIRRDELSETYRAESEIVRKALAKTNFSLNTEGTYNFGLSKGKAKTASGRDAETNSNDVKKSFREAVRKASEELRSERSMEVSFEQEDSFESTSSGRIENTNQELTLTYLFFELQRRFRVNETIQKATPVILVAQDVPSPDQINNAFLVRHAWVIRRALLDDGFLPALDYVQGQIVGDRLETLSRKKTLDTHRAQTRELKSQLVALEEQAGRRYEALVRAVKDRLREEGREESDGFFSDLGESLFGGGEETGTARLREEAARDAEQRAAAQAKDMATQLQRAVNALNEATEAYNRANNRFQMMSVEVSRLRLHVKEHILHYMQAIWSYEVEDQRFLRLYRQPVPQFVHQEAVETLYRRLGEGAGISRVHVTGGDGEPVVAETRRAVDFELLPSIQVLPAEFDRPLVEVADLTTLLGFLGNYMIFPMKQSNALTDLLLNPYVDEGLRLLDPDDPGNITRPEFAEYICRLRKRLTPEQFEDIRDDLAARYRELLLSSEYSGDEIVVPSGALYMDALPGARPLLESFKLAHRAFDLVGAQEDARMKTLENLRRAARLVGEEWDDPETDARYDFYGAPGVTVSGETGGGGSGGDGG